MLAGDGAARGRWVNSTGVGFPVAGPGSAVEEAERGTQAAVASSKRNHSPNTAQTRPESTQLSPYYGSFSLESRWVVSNPKLLLISKF